jgi:hypothetical protein
MRSKSIINAFVVLCITAILAIAVCGCEDLGSYDDTSEYYDCFGNIIFVDGVTGDYSDYSVEDCFYNKESKENFLAGENGEYMGVPHDYYEYVAIPVERTIDMDTLALYIQADDKATVYISIYVANEIPNEDDTSTDTETTGAQSESSDVSDTAAEGQSAPLEEGKCSESDMGSDPDNTIIETERTESVSEEAETESETPEQTEEEVKTSYAKVKIGEIVIQLNGGKWDSFVLDEFDVNGQAQKSIQINEGQYILMHIRNNSGLRNPDAEDQASVEPQTENELQSVKITMTNLLVRTLDIANDD